MFSIIKQLEANRIEMAAPKRSLLQKLVGIYKSYKSKKAYQALIIAKREEKAAVAKTNAELATEMEARSEALITESALCYRTNKVESDRLMEEAAELASKAASLRFL